MSVIGAMPASQLQSSGAAVRGSVGSDQALSFAELLGLSEINANSEAGEYWFDLYDQLKDLAEQESWQFEQDQPFLSQLPPEGQFRVISMVSQFDDQVQQQVLQMMRRADGLQSVDVQLGQLQSQSISQANGEQHSLNFSQAVERMMANAMVPVRPEHNNPELLQSIKPGQMSNISMLMTQSANFTSATAEADSQANVQARSEWAPVKVDENKQVWGQQMLSVLKDRVQMQMNQDVSQARIRLDPPHLGTLELAVKVDNNKVHVQLFASVPTLREAISQQAERLRFDLESKQLQGATVDVDVSDQPQDDNQEPLYQEQVVAQSNWHESILQSSGQDDHRITRLI
ncbi:flagellar hook-length control protein FliK [Vibrio sp.]|uniref:flagellar hook-length control protein FliK n=1 Tax=Vibrio sp. TaxID=678 RepID=UPI003794162C